MRNVPATCGFTLLIAVLAVGCLPLIEKPTPSRTLVLSFPDAATNSVSGSLPAAQAPQIKQALVDIEELLRKEGYRRVSNPIEEGAPGYIATFAQTEQNGFKSYCRPILKVRQTDVLINFDELGVRGGQLHSETKHLVELLGRELSSRYGAQNVKIER